MTRPASAAVAAGVMPGGAGLCRDTTDPAAAPPADDGAELLRRSVTGDRTAFEAFVRRWERPLGRFLLRVTGTVHLAEEARHLTFVRVLRKGDSFRGGSVSTWLFRTALRIAIDLRRAETRHPAAPLDDVEIPDAGPGPLGAAAGLEERENVRTALARLEPEDRALLWMRVADGRTFAAVAEALGLPESTTRLRFVRALARLRAEIERPPAAPAARDGCAGSESARKTEV